jgi:hypothetical protein
VRAELPLHGTQQTLHFTPLNISRGLHDLRRLGSNCIYQSAVYIRYKYLKSTID